MAVIRRARDFVPDVREPTREARHGLASVISGEGKKRLFFSSRSFLFFGFSDFFFKLFIYFIPKKAVVTGHESQRSRKIVELITF